MNTISVDDLRSIAANGGGLDLHHGKNLSIADFRSIAANASPSKATIIINPTGLSVDDMRSIAANGQGSVLFQNP